jgi:hypothetical protein
MPPIASNALGNVNHDQGVDTPCSGRCRGFHCRHDARARALVRSLIAIREPGPPSSAYAGPYRGRQTGFSVKQWLSITATKKGPLPGGLLNLPSANALDHGP